MKCKRGILLLKVVLICTPVVFVGTATGAAPAAQATDVIDAAHPNVQGVVADGRLSGARAEACCMPDDSCVDDNPPDCIAAGGTPMGPGTQCATTICSCDWEPGDPAKWVQLPDLTTEGIDVRVDSFQTLPRIMADDFECTSRELITDVHIWGSWLGDLKGQITSITLSIWSNNPSGPNQYSIPDQRLWQRDFGPGEFSERLHAIVDPGEWWWNPVAGSGPIPFGDTQVWQINICIDPADAFRQQGSPDNPIIYWLGVQVMIDSGQFGWKTRQWPDHFMDDAVWAEGELPWSWNELRYPPGHPYHGLEDDSIDLAFVITGEEQPEHDLGDAPDSSNTWLTSMTAYPATGVAANYPSVYQAGSPPYGPLHRQPRDVAYLGQWVTLENEADIGPDEDPTNNIIPLNDLPDQDGADDGVAVPLVLPHCQMTTFDYVVTIVTAPAAQPLYVNAWFDWNRDGDYDDTMDCAGVAAPEWAVRNQQVVVPGPGQFTITSLAFLPWHPATPGGGVPPIWMRITISEQQWAPGPDPGSGGSGPLGGYDVGETEDYYFTPELLQACCLPDDSCIDVPPTECVNTSGIPMGPGTQCATTICSCDWYPNDPAKWIQLPDLTTEGIDIRMDSNEVPRIMADDFECTSRKLITDVHLWGSWLDDLKGQITSIHLSIWSNNPSGPNQYSIPDQLLWAQNFGPGEFSERLHAVVDQGEWWWDPIPGGGLIPFGDTQVWQINICIDPEDAFRQDGTPENPIIYWLGVQIMTDSGQFGWKTRQWPDHYMDDAVWAWGMLPWSWNELRYPPGHPYYGLEDDSIDLAFVITGQKPQLNPKWSQPPHGPGEGFDAPSDLWWPVKWEQLPDPNWPGLHAHDWTDAAGGYHFSTLADDWQCQGGDVKDLHWWGNYELDTAGQEIRGAGIDYFHLSFHLCAPGGPWCVPLDPEFWGIDVPFASIAEQDTGLVNIEGSRIYLYEFDLPAPYPQEFQTYYWFDITAIAIDPGNPAHWRWQEARRDFAPPLGHAPAAQKTDSTPWQSITWPTIPESYSDMAFRVTSGRDDEVNKVLADDFISDGRPIEALIWWGSYWDETYGPATPVIEPYVLDGWLISFHHVDPDLPCPPEPSAANLPTALGVYFAPADAVEITSIFAADCFGHDVYLYEVDLNECCLICSEMDPRPEADPPYPAQPDAFLETHGLWYWLDIQAVTGVEWVPDPQGTTDDCIRQYTGHLPSPITTDGHFWGWHTSPAAAMPHDPLNEACTGRIVDFSPYPPDCWDYGNWQTQPWICPEPPLPEPVHMAFELLTSEVMGDCTGDGHVDIADYIVFESCITGPNAGPIAAGCECADLDVDDDVDVKDFGLFQIAFTG
ncbi:MAG: hypothetical protein JSV19_08665 [Phycisphaerales bacterium]|nr:MAG: hypothetical protein JSV19_08665 [Phycisphaerales bacterium]